MAEAVVIKGVGQDDAQNGVVTVLEIPCSLLHEWHKSKKSYVDQLNHHIKSHAMQLQEPCQRVEGRLRREAGTISTNIFKASRHNKAKIMAKKYLLKV